MASGERTLMVRFLGDSTSAEKATNKVAAAGDKLTASSKVTGEALSDVKSKLLGMVPGGSAAEGALKKMGSASEGAGISMSGALAGGAAVAGVALAKMTADGVGKFASLTGEVSKFKNVTGATSEEASKFVSIAHGMGVETDVMSAAMFKMGNVIATTPAKLTDLGIAIAHNKDGTVDMVGTLENAATAYQNSTDATEKDAIAKALGGKAGAALIPILKQGKDAVDEFAKSAKQRGEIFSDKDLAQGAEFRKSMRELGQSVGAIEVQFGKELVPVLTKTAEGFAKIMDKSNELQQSWEKSSVGSWIKKNLDPMKEWNKVTDDTSAATKKKDAAEQYAKTTTEALDKATEAVTETAKEEKAAYDAASKAIDDHTKSMEAATKASEDAMGADIAYARALDDNKLVADKVKAAQDALNTAVKEHTSDSAEARQATAALNGAVLDGEETYRKAADAAVELTAKHHEMAGEAYSAEQKHQDLINMLGTFAGQLDENSPIRQALGGYIRELESIPGEIRTTIAIEGDDFHIVRRDATDIPHAASGGIVRARAGGTAVLVGEGGRDEAIVPLSAAGLGGTGGVTIHLTLTGAVVGTMQQLADMLGPHIANALNKGARRGVDYSTALGLS